MEVSSELSLDGKLFVEFIALIYLSYFKKKMQDKNLFKNYTVQGLTDEFDVIECFEQPGRDLRFGEVTKRQMELFRHDGNRITYFIIIEVEIQVIGDINRPDLVESIYLRVFQQIGVYFVSLCGFREIWLG